MTSTFPTRPTTGPLRRSKNSGDEALLALFAQFPNPALLVDRGNGSIVSASGALLTLTAFAQTDIVGRPLQVLLSGLPGHALATDETLNVMLERRNRPALAMRVHTRGLDAAGQFLVLSLEPEEDRSKELAARMEQVVEAMVAIGRLADDQHPRQSLAGAVERIRGLLDCSAVAFYCTDGIELGMPRTAAAGETNLLPEAIPATDLLRLENPMAWKPGRRVQTELHRHARVHNCTSLVSTPTPHNGILVIADRRQEPSGELVILLEALGKQIGLLLDQLARLGELRKLALENRRALSVWHAVGEFAQEGIILLSPELTVSTMNPAAEWMLGYAEWEVKDQPVENILIGPERLLPALEAAGQGIPTHNMGNNVSLHRRNGQSFPVHIEIIPVQREGEILATVIFFSDVSEHEEIRNRTQQLEQRAVLGEVTAVFAHEVRNPINNISTGLQLLSVKLPENDPNQENINRLLNDCTRLNHLMESVLNFSRHSEHKFEAVNIEHLLRRLLDRWRPRMAKVNVQAFFQVEENTPLVMADPRSMEQVFTNLIGNAVEAMSANGGTLAVRAQPFREGQGRPQVEITVSDNGPGIPDEIRERIYEPFVTTKAQGTGLGLAITKRIVTAHRGSIRLNSFPGGTVFHVFLNQFEAE